MHLHSNPLPYLVLLLLILFGCGPQDPTEDTPFLKAIRRSQMDSVQIMLKQDPTLLAQQTEIKGLTPLHVAARYAKPEVVEYLIEQGADVNAQSSDGQTPLHEAAEVIRVKNANRIRILLEAGADPSIENQKGLDVWEFILDETPFDLSDQGAIAMGLMLRHGYEPDMQPDETGKTILHELAEHCPAAEPIDLLIAEHGMNPDIQDINGWTPLHFAALGQNYEAAEALLKLGADIHATTTHGVKEIIRDTEGLSGEAAKTKYRYPVGSTPLDVLKKQGGGSRFDKNLRPLFEAYQ